MGQGWSHSAGIFACAMQDNPIPSKVTKSFIFIYDISKTRIWRLFEMNLRVKRRVISIANSKICYLHNEISSSITYINGLYDDVRKIFALLPSFWCMKILWRFFYYLQLIMWSRGKWIKIGAGVFKGYKAEKLAENSNRAEIRTSTISSYIPTALKWSLNSHISPSNFIFLSKERDNFLIWDSFKTIWSLELLWV